MENKKLIKNKISDELSKIANSTIKKLDKDRNYHYKQIEKAEKQTTALIINWLHLEYIQYLHQNIISETDSQIDNLVYFKNEKEQLIQLKAEQELLQEFIKNQPPLDNLIDLDEIERLLSFLNGINKREDKITTSDRIATLIFGEILIILCNKDLKKDTIVLNTKRKQQQLKRQDYLAINNILKALDTRIHFNDDINFENINITVSTLQAIYYDLITKSNTILSNKSYTPLLIESNKEELRNFLREIDTLYNLQSKTEISLFSNKFNSIFYI